MLNGFNDELIVAGQVEERAAGPGVDQLNQRLVYQGVLRKKAINISYLIHQIHKSTLYGIALHAAEQETDKGPSAGATKLEGRFCNEKSAPKSTVVHMFIGESRTLSTFFYCSINASSASHQSTVYLFVKLYRRPQTCESSC